VKVRKSPVQIVVGAIVIAIGGYLASSPLVVADALGKPHETSSQMINLRASWGGTLMGLGAFVAWLPAFVPWRRTVVGLLMWAMAGIGLARLLGFAVDGNPDSRQFVWILAEIALVAGCAVGLRRMRRN
jgi:hypothetical protein